MESTIRPAAPAPDPDVEPAAATDAQIHPPRSPGTTPEPIAEPVIEPVIEPVTGLSSTAVANWRSDAGRDDWLAMWHQAHGVEPVATEKLAAESSRSAEIADPDPIALEPKYLAQPLTEFWSRHRTPLVAGIGLLVAVAAVISVITATVQADRAAPRIESTLDQADQLCAPQARSSRPPRPGPSPHG